MIRIVVIRTITMITGIIILGVVMIKALWFSESNCSSEGKNNHVELIPWAF